MIVPILPRMGAQPAGPVTDRPLVGPRRPETEAVAAAGPHGTSGSARQRVGGEGVLPAGWRVLGELGRGAQSVVYRAARAGGDEFAIKILSVAPGDREALPSLRREAALLAGVVHPGLPRVHEVGSSGGLPYLIMDLVVGRPLAQVIRAAGLPPSRVVALAVDLAGQLAALHARGLVHRDLKTQNVMITDAGRARLIDFGLTAREVRETDPAQQDGAAVGTFAYMSPEQSGVLRRPVDARSDLYSLGVLLFECLTGRLPFEAANVGELLRMHLAVTPPDLRTLLPSAGTALPALVGTLLAKDPDDRYQDAHRLLLDLERIAADPDAAVGAGAPAACSGAVPGGATLVGRQTDLAALTRHWRRARSGRGGVVLLHGVPGIGTSRLAEELAGTAARDGAVVLAGRGGRLDPVPFAALRGAVEAHLESIDRAETGVRERSEQRWTAAGGAAPVLGLLSARVAELLGHPQQPADDDADRFPLAAAELLLGLAREHEGLLLHLDEAQWLDAGTRRVLRALAGRLDQAPLLVLLTARDGEEATALTAHLADAFGRHVVQDLALSPLDEHAVADLVTGALPGVTVGPLLGRLLRTRTQGNPLMVLEYVRAIVDAGLLTPCWGDWQLDETGLAALELPQDVLGLVLSRIGGLTDAGRQVLTVAAVLGSRFRSGLLAAVSGRPEREVRDLLAGAAELHLVEPVAGGPGQDRYEFLHDSIREGLLDVPSDVLARLHQDVAERLDGLLPARERTAAQRYTVADHYRRGRVRHAPEAVRRRAVAAWTAAGRQALSDVTSTEAVAYLRPAVELAAELDGDPGPELLELLGAALRLAAAHAEAIEVLGQALERQPDPYRRAVVLHHLAECHRGRWDARLATEACRRAMAELGDPWPRTRIGLLVTTAWRLALAGLVSWTGIGAGTTDTARRERYSLLLAVAETAVYAAIIDLRTAETLALSLRGRLRALQLGPSIQYVRSAASVASHLHLLGARRRARAMLSRAERVADDLADPSARALVRFHRGAMAYLGGQDEGEAWSQGLQEAGRYWDSGAYFDAVSALCAEEALRGRVAEVARYRDLTARRVGDHDGEDLNATVTTGSAAAALVGRHAEASEQLRQALTRTAPATSAGMRLIELVAEFYVLVEQGETGQPFDDCVARFEALGLPAYGMLRGQRGIHLFVAEGRLAQCRAATGPQRAVRLAQAAAAVRRQRLVALGGSQRALGTVARADLAILRGRPRTALRLLGRVPPQDPVSPRVTYETARVRARALTALGLRGEAEVAARLAHLVAQHEGWPHRARWVRAEFDPAAASALPRQQHPTSSVDGRQGLEHQRLQALQEVARAASRVLDPDELARIALDETIRILSAERAFLFLASPEREGALVQHLGRDAAGNDLTELTGYSTTLVDRVRVSREPLVMTGTDEGAALGSRSVVVHGLRSILVAPLQLDDRLLGVVYLDSQVAKGIFTEDDAGIMIALTNHIATALETVRAAQLEVSVQITRRQRDVTEALRQSLERLSATLDPAQVLARLLESASRLVPCAHAWVLQDEPGPDAAPSWPVTGEPVGGPAGTAPPAVADLLQTLPEPAAEWLALPLTCGDRVLGALVLAGARPGSFPAETIDVATAVVAQAMTAYDRAALFTRVQELAVVDELTGVPNRRRFFERAERDVADALYAGRSVAALMLDIDRFKRINDGHGHQVGDDVIREVAARVAALIGGTDILGRYGGEEFAVVVPGIQDADALAAFAERVRAAVADAPVGTRSGPVEVTVSVGGALLRPDDADLTGLLARADRALYRAKEGGRNRVCAA